MFKHHLLISAAVIVLDRFTKWLIIRKIALYNSVDVIRGLFRITHLENTGAAFSLFADWPGPWPGRILVVFSFSAIVVIMVLLWKSRNTLTLGTIALALVL